MFYDTGVTGSKNTNWENYSNRLGVSTTATGTKLTGASTNGYYFVNAHDKFIFTDYTLEFDLIDLTGSVRWYHQNEQGSNKNIFILDTYVTGACKVKITVLDGVATLYLDEEQKATSSVTINAPYEMGFRTTNGTNNTITYKNFKVYSI